MVHRMHKVQVLYHRSILVWMTNIFFGKSFSYDSGLLESPSPLVKSSPLFYGKIICIFPMRERPEGLAQKSHKSLWKK